MSLETSILSSVNHPLFRWKKTRVYSVALCMKVPLYLWPPLLPSNLSKLYPIKAQSALPLWQPSLLWQLYSALNSQYCKLLLWMRPGRGVGETKGAAFQNILQGKIHPLPPMHTQVPKTCCALLSPSCSTDLLGSEKDAFFTGVNFSME